MPFEKDARRLADIIENADAIARYTASIDSDGLKADAMRRDAVERCLERISEAASRLGQRAPELVPDQPWEQVRALGNRLRHEYDRIHIDRLWEIVERDLPSLRSACVEALTRLERQRDR